MAFHPTFSLHPSPSTTPVNALTQRQAYARATTDNNNIDETQPFQINNDKMTTISRPRNRKNSKQQHRPIDVVNVEITNNRMRTIDSLL